MDVFDTQTDVSTPNVLEATQSPDGADFSRVIVVCDSSKFGRSSLSSIVPLSNMHGVITGNEILRQHLRALKKARIEVVLV